MPTDTYIPHSEPSTPVLLLLVFLHTLFALASALLLIGELVFILTRSAVATAWPVIVLCFQLLLVQTIELVRWLLAAAVRLAYSCARSTTLAVACAVRVLLGVAIGLAANLLVGVAHLTLAAARTARSLLVCVVQVLLVSTHDLALWLLPLVSSAIARTLMAVVRLPGLAASLVWRLLETRPPSTAEEPPASVAAAAVQILSSVGRMASEYFTCREGSFATASFRSDRALGVSVTDDMLVSRSVAVSVLSSIWSFGRVLASVADSMNIVRNTVMSCLSDRMDIVRDAVLPSIAGRHVFVEGSVLSGMQAVHRSAFSFADGMTMNGWPSVSSVPSSNLRMDSYRSFAPPANVVSAGIAGFETLRELGRGGFGIVYLVQETGSATLQAAKVLTKGVGSALQLLQNEINIHQLVSRSFEGGCHSNLVRLDRVIEGREEVTLVMENCSGGTLRDHSNSLGRNVLTDAAAARLLLPVAKGLAHLHSLGVAHRDLKMENILLDASSKPKIADFGLATRERLCRDRPGTECTMPPELINRTSFSPAYDPCKSDVWALGIVFFQLKFRHLPWEKADYQQAQFLDYLDSQSDFFTSQPGMGNASFLLLRGLLHLDPSRRFSAGDVVRRLERMAQSD